MDIGTAVVTGASFAAALVVVGGATIAIWQSGARKYRLTFGSRRDLTRRLNELACGATMQYVEARFGAPIFRSKVGPAEEYVQHIYRTRHAWIAVWYGKDEAVKAFSITVTDPRLHYRTRWLTFDQLDVVLGHSTFSDVSKGGDSRLNIGARRGEYAEAYYLGNPGHYAHYFLSYNDAGCGRFDMEARQHIGKDHWASGILQEPSDPADSPPPAPDLARFRAGVAVNTLTIVGPNAEPSIIAKNRIGVDLDVLRMLRT